MVGFAELWHRRVVRRSIATSIVLAFGIGTMAAPDARADCPGNYEFVLIADDSGDFEDFALSDPDRPGINARPSLNNGGRVVFRAWLSAGGMGLYHGDENGLLELMRDQQADPSSEWQDMRDPVISGEGHVGFWGEYETGTPPLFYRAVGRVTFGNSPQVVAFGNGGANTQAPSPYTSVGDTVDITTGGDVVFAVTLPGGVSAIVSGTGIAGGTPRELVSSEGDRSVRGFREPSAGGVGGVAFLGNPVDDPSRFGLYRKTAGGIPFEIALSDDNGLGPDSQPSLGPGGAVAYALAYPDPDDPLRAAQRIRRWSPLTQTSVTLADSFADPFRQAATRTRVSLLDRTEIASEGPSQGGGGCVVFNGSADDDGSDVIYLVDEDGLQEVIRDGDELFGALVGALDISSRSVNAFGQVAFWAQLTDSRQVIVRADPEGLVVPGPGDGPIGGAGGDPTNDPGGDGGGCTVSHSGELPPLVALVLVLASAVLRRTFRLWLRPSS